MKIIELQKKVIELERLLSIQNIEPLDVKQTAEYLKLKPSYIYSLIHQNKIPYHKPNGKRVYFFKSDLNKWILGSKFRSVDEVEADYNKQKESGK